MIHHEMTASLSLYVLWRVHQGLFVIYILSIPHIGSLDKCNSSAFKALIYTTQNLLKITFSFNDLMLKTNRLKKDFFL